MSDAPLFVNPVVGFRTRLIDREAVTLNPLFRGDAWPVREPIISTHVNEGYGRYAPRDCHSGEPCNSCGIWAFDTYERVAHHRKANFTDPAEVRGLVAGWGKVILSDYGWRAGRAYPLALFEWGAFPHHVPDGIDWHYAMFRVAKRYGVPIINDASEVAEVVERADAVWPCEYMPDREREEEPEVTATVYGSLPPLRAGVKFEIPIPAPRL